MTEELNSLLNTLKEGTEEYAFGDLMLLFDVIEGFEKLVSFADLYPIKNMKVFLEKVHVFAQQLSHPQEIDFKQETLLKVLHILKELKNPESEKRTLVQDLSSVVKDIKAYFDAQKEKAKEKSLEQAMNYSEDYFTRIVKDSKMLSQMADEANEHMDAAQTTLLELEYDSENQENINRVFRSFHTIKGSSSFLGLKNVEEVSHEMESLFMLVRDGKLKVSQDLIDVIFLGIDILRTLVGIMETNEFVREKMIDSFKKVDIFSYIRLVRKILSQYSMKKIGEILEEEGKLAPSEVRSILNEQKDTGAKFGEIAVEKNKVKEEDIAAAIRKQASTVRKPSYVKVSNERLNQLIDIVGELVINQSMVKQSIMEGKTGEQSITQLEGITTNIKNLVLSMGMVPVSEIFNKLRVVIRNTTKELGKTIIVEIKGEDTELDRNVIQAIYDPLVHMVRNAVDHGMEMPDEREKNGKDRVGDIKIAAQHRGNGIEISVQDDGKGIDKKNIIQKAIEKKLITPEEVETLKDKDIFALMFEPGFSTAKKVTEISGRGVGLDVVKKNIESIRGKIEVSSELGKFTRFVIRLPLTLAIIEGFVTEIGENRYVFPFDSVEEVIVPELAQTRRMEDGQLMLFHREKHLPLLFAGAFLNEVGYKHELKEKPVILLILFDGQYYGVVVDRVLGKQETVIKNLNEALSGLSVFSGGTIFGDGNIGFVVDIEEFLLMAGR